MTRILSQRQFAEASSLSRQTIERLWRAGKIQRVQLSERRFGYPASQLDELVNRNLTPHVKTTQGDTLKDNLGKTRGR